MDQCKYGPVRLKAVEPTAPVARVESRQAVAPRRRPLRLGEQVHKQEYGGRRRKQLGAAFQSSLIDAVDRRGHMAEHDTSTRPAERCGRTDLERAH